MEEAAGEAPRRGWRKPLLWLAAVILVLALAFVGGRAYVNSQWFVGVHEDHVAIFRGIPTDILGYDLFTLVEETDLDAARVARLDFWKELPDGITADSEARAHELVAQMERDLQEDAQPPT